MAKQVSKTVIGGFVVSAIALLVMGVVIFGGGKYFTKTAKYVLFFDQSVKGLHVGAPVVFRGVEIGTVQSVVIHADTEKFEVDIPVVIEVEPDKFQIKGKREMPKNPYDRAKVLIDRGLRGQLITESFVTGQLMVAMDFHPDQPAQLKRIDAGYPELPTIPSDFEQLTKKLKKLPIEEISEKILSAVQNVEKVLSAPELMETIENLKTATAKASTLIEDVDRVVNDADKMLVSADQKIEALATRGENVLVSAEGALDSATLTLNTYGSLVDEKSPLRNDLIDAVSELGEAARSLRAFFEYLEQHPEALIKGKSSSGGK
jgi:paraquat-inducible protein B